MKVSIIGAGSVGATSAEYLAIGRIASEIVLLDVKKGIAEGKALDIKQTSSLLGFDAKIEGVTNDYNSTANSQVVVITAGLPRNPGMSREELIGTNAPIIETVLNKSLHQSPEAIIVMVANPMDTMTYLAHKITSLRRNKIIGMGGALDSARFKMYLAAALNKSIGDICGMVIGGHGDKTMIPLIRLAAYNGVPVSEFLTDEAMKKVVADTMVGGATLTKLLGTSAWYAPGAAIAYLVESILFNQKKTIPCSVLLAGEYDQTDICIGVPCIIGREGWEKIVPISLNKKEKSLFEQSASAVSDMNATLKKYS